jgi:DNA repair ATPase RecN
MSLKIVELQAENIKRLKSVTIRPESDVVIIGGENEQGKTSAFDAIRMVLGGAKATPDVPVRRGANEGRVLLDLGDLTAELVIDASGRKLIVRDADGHKKEKPQAILDRLYSKVAFDPLAFANKKPAEQREILKGLVGLDFTEQDKKRKALYDERTAVGRVRDDAEVRVSQFPASLVSAPGEEVNISALLAEKAKADAHNREFEKRERACTTAEEEVRRLTQLLGEAQAKLDAANGMFEITPARIATDEIDQRLAGAENINRQVRAKKDLAKSVSAFKSADREYYDLTIQIEGIDAHKEQALANAKWPIPGLGFSADGITMHGLPFDAASKAERMKVSLAIGCALYPELHVLLLEDASLLDKSSMAIVRELAAENDMQLWLERVGSADAGAIIIEDGEVANYSDEV